MKALERPKRVKNLFEMKPFVYTVNVEIRIPKATEDVLCKVYEGAAIGLKEASLAYYAGLTLREFNSLMQLDSRMEMAVIAGKADAETALSKSLHEAALGKPELGIPGDPKVALDILKYKHKWVAEQVIKQEITGKDGGAVRLESVNLRSLTSEELKLLEATLTKVSGEEG